MKLSAYNFNQLPGLVEYKWEAPLNFVGTGMANGYSLNWMSKAGNRRDWGSGISGSHLAAEPATCFHELKLVAPYPDDSYRITLTGSLRLLDLRRVESPAFSGDYYSQDRSFSCQIIDYNRDYITAQGYDGILRYSQPLLTGGQYSEVVALTPAAIGKLGVHAIHALGNVTTPLTITLADGSTYTPTNVK